MSFTVSEQLPLLAAAPNGIRKLRELILELAVRGKLVAQDASDEPASELLKRIAAEKKRLVAAGRIKQPKALAEIAEEERPFEVPQGWAWARLGEVCTYIQRGKGPAYVEQSDYAVVSQKCVRWKGLDLMPSRFIDPSSIGAYEEVRLLRPGDILWNSTGTGTIGRACVVEKRSLARPLVADSHVTVVRTIELSPTFTWRWIQSPSVQSEIEGNASGTTNQIELNTSTVISHLIPLPPVSEQHRIVAKVDELMALCDRLEAQQADAESAHAQLVTALLDSLTQASDSDDFAASWQRLSAHFYTLFATESSIDALKQTLLQLAVMGKLVPQDSNDEPASELLSRIAAERARLVGEGEIKKLKKVAEIAEIEKLFELPPGWAWTRLEGVAQVGTGATPLRTNPRYFDPASVSWVTSGETSQALIFETAQKVSPLALIETNLTVYPPHTLIIAMYGQGKTRGQISELLIEACTNQACAAVQLLDQDPSLRSYVKYFFIKSYDEIRLLSAGGAQPNLNLGKVKDSVIPLPPPAEQHRIVAKVDQLMALCDQLRSRLTQASQLNEQLAAALVQRAVA